MTDMSRDEEARRLIFQAKRALQRACDHAAAIDHDDEWVTPEIIAEAEAIRQRCLTRLALINSVNLTTATRHEIHALVHRLEGGSLN
jgi:hypothetical protein